MRRFGFGSGDWGSGIFVGGCACVWVRDLGAEEIFCGKACEWPKVLEGSVCGLEMAGFFGGVALEGREWRGVRVVGVVESREGLVIGDCEFVSGNLGAVCGLEMVGGFGGVALEGREWRGVRVVGVVESREGLVIGDCEF